MPKWSSPSWVSNDSSILYFLLAYLGYSLDNRFSSSSGENKLLDKLISSFTPESPNREKELIGDFNNYSFLAISNADCLWGERESRDSTVKSCADPSLFEWLALISFSLWESFSSSLILLKEQVLSGYYRNGFGLWFIPVSILRDF